MLKPQFGSITNGLGFSWIAIDVSREDEPMAQN